MTPKIVSPTEWLISRKELLEKEKEATRLSDTLATLRRALPMVKISKSYMFEGPKGRASLLDLFEGRKQLIIYHFMYAPEAEEGCSSCSFVGDHIPDLRHLNSRDTTFAMVSRAPIAKIEAFKKRMGWKMPWYSSFGEPFNYDFNVTQDEEVQPIEYNFDDKATMERKGLVWAMQGEQPGMSVFLVNDEEVYHTYSSYGRGGEVLLNTYSLLDATPTGRQEKGKVGITSFLHHDQYSEAK